jgi:hypothetical protein
VRGVSKSRASTPGAIRYYRRIGEADSTDEKEGVIVRLQGKHFDAPSDGIWVGEKLTK